MPSVNKSEELWLEVFGCIEELNRFHEVSDRDVTEILEGLKAAPNSQLLRRTIARNFAAHVEGFIFMVKQFALSLSKISTVKFDRRDLALLAEARRYVDAEGKEHKLAFLEFHENLKFAFESYARVNGFTYRLDYKEKRYGDFRLAIEVRNRLMHPKSLATFIVSDTEMEQIGRGRSWCREQVVRLLRSRASRSVFRGRFSRSSATTDFNGGDDPSGGRS